MLVNRESEQMTFSTKFDALLQSKVAARAQVVKATGVANMRASADNQLRDSQHATVSPRTTTRLSDYES
jgi:hypothetical protein